MIERILPDRVAVAWTGEDVPDSELMPEEAALVSAAVESRRREFATVRSCAREALGALGLPPVAVLRGPRGEPRWPEKVVGSMTHCSGYRAAAVAAAAEVHALGIDAEPNLPLPDGVLEAIARAEELPRLRRLKAVTSGGFGAAAVSCDRLLFSAKESVYKAWFPMTGLPLDFSEASLEFTPLGTFTARLLVPGPLYDGSRLQSFRGRWLAAGGFVFTSVVVPGLPANRPDETVPLAGVHQISTSASTRGGVRYTVRRRLRASDRAAEGLAD